jgi:protein SCO1/2
MTRMVLALLILLASAGAAQAFDPLADARIDPRPNAEVPIDQILRNQSGTRTTLRDLAAGKPILLVPVQFHCPNICGVTLAGLLQAVTGQKFVAGDDFSLVAFSIDPTETPRDAQQLLDRLAAEFPAVAVQGLTGEDGNIAALTDALGYRFAWDPDLQQFDHVAAVAVLTPDGRLSNWLYGVSPEPRDIALALTEAGAGRVGRWTDQLLLLCYHYDPVNGHYTPIVWTALRVIAGGALAIALLCLGRALFHERGRAGSGRL